MIFSEATWQAVSPSHLAEAVIPASSFSLSFFPTPGKPAFRSSLSSESACRKFFGIHRRPGESCCHRGELRWGASGTRRKGLGFGSPLGADLLFVHCRFLHWITCFLVRRPGMRAGMEMAMIRLFTAFWTPTPTSCGRTRTPFLWIRRTIWRRHGREWPDSVHSSVHTCISITWPDTQPGRKRQAFPSLPDSRISTTGKSSATVRKISIRPSVDNVQSFSHIFWGLVLLSFPVPENPSFRGHALSPSDRFYRYHAPAVRWGPACCHSWQAPHAAGWHEGVPRAQETHHHRRGKRLGDAVQVLELATEQDCFLLTEGSLFIWSGPCLFQRFWQQKEKRRSALFFAPRRFLSG